MVVGVVADTHIPDRVNTLHPDLLDALRSAGVEKILHAGDICAPAALNALSQVAPVTAVRGNRDWLFVGSLPMVRRIMINGVPVVLLHGHGRPSEYFQSKIWYTLRGYAFDYFAPVLRSVRGAARVVVFGHSHYPENRWENGCLYFNPGAASYNVKTDESSFGLLRIGPGGQLAGEIVPLRRIPVLRRTWQVD